MLTKDAYILGDVRAARVVLECDLCSRRGEWSTQRLIDKHGRDITMPDLKAELVTCTELRVNPLSPCRATYSAETRQSWQRQR